MKESVRQASKKSYLHLFTPWRAAIRPIARIETINGIKKLPDCPCRDPDEHSVRLNDGWAVDKGNIDLYHPGARICFRSYPAVKTSAGLSGQQCCYDSDGSVLRMVCKPSVIVLKAGNVVSTNS